jgi:KaiC/GvpD/RAD55 family RecA-like ATPase
MGSLGMEEKNFKHEPENVRSGHRFSGGPSVPSEDHLRARRLFPEGDFWDQDPDRAKEPLPMLIDGLLYEGKAHLLYAPPGVGKSMVSLWFAKELAEKGRRTWIFDLEMGKATAWRRLIQMGLSPQTGRETVSYFGHDALVAVLDPRHAGEKIHDSVKAAKERGEGPDITIWDSWYKFLGALSKDESSNADVGEFASNYFSPFLSQGVAILVQDHPGKDPNSGPRGATTKMGFFDVVLQIRKIRDFGTTRRGRLELRGTNEDKRSKDRHGQVMEKTHLEIGGELDERLGTRIVVERLPYSVSQGSTQEDEPREEGVLEEAPLGETARRILDVLPKEGCDSANDWFRLAKSANITRSKGTFHRAVGAMVGEGLVAKTYVGMNGRNEVHRYEHAGQTSRPDPRPKGGSRDKETDKDEGRNPEGPRRTALDEEESEENGVDTRNSLEAGPLVHPRPPLVPDKTRADTSGPCPGDVPPSEGDLHRQGQDRQDGREGEDLRNQGSLGPSRSLTNNAWNDDVITGTRKENTFEGDLLGHSAGEPTEEPVEEGPRWDPEGGQDFDEFLKDLMEKPVREAPPNGGVRPNPGPDLTDTDVVILEAVEKGDREGDVKVKTRLSRDLWERHWKSLLRRGYVGPADGGGHELKPLGQKALDAPRRTRPGARPSGR